jgi:uncharacterized low-complexity protein
MKKTVITTAVGLASAITFGAAQAAGNPFAMKDLGNGYQVAQKHNKEAGDAKGMDAKCGNEKKMKDGKCGEGKCGGAKKDDKK